VPSWTEVTPETVIALGRDWLDGSRSVALPAAIAARLRDLEHASAMTKVAIPFDVEKLKQRPVAPDVDVEAEATALTPAQLIQERVLILAPLRDTRTVELREGIVRGYNIAEDYHVIDWDESVYQEKYQRPWPTGEPTTVMSKLDSAAKKARKGELKVAGDWLLVKSKPSGQRSSRQLKRKEQRAEDEREEKAEEAQQPAKKKRRHEVSTGQEPLLPASSREIVLPSGESDALSLSAADGPRQLPPLATRRSRAAGDDLVGQRVEILFEHANGKRWYCGKVTRQSETRQSHYVIVYDNGDHEQQVPLLPSNQFEWQACPHLKGSCPHSWCDSRYDSSSED